MRGLSWHPSGPLTPGDALEAGRVDAHRLLRLPPCAASSYPACSYPSWLRPRRHAKEQHSTYAPDMVRQSRHHGRCLGLPAFRRPCPVRWLRQHQGYPQAGMREAKVVVRLVESQLLPQPILALAQRADPAPDCGDMLANAEVDPLHEGGVDMPAMGSQHGIDGLQCAKHDAVTHPYQATAAYGLDDLRVEQVWELSLIHISEP